MIGPDHSRYAAARTVELWGRVASQLGDATRADSPTLIVEIAAATVPGTQSASITEGRRGRFRTVASTDPVAAGADAIQYSLGAGPCVDATVTDAVFRTDDVAQDQRWPEFGRRAHAETGVTSMLATRLFLENDGDRIAALNLYSTELAAFTANDQVIATVLAAHSALALMAINARAKSVNLERGLLSSREIGAAIGILMATHKITSESAFGLLKVASQNTNRKLLDIARDVIDTGALDLPAATGPDRS